VIVRQELIEKVLDLSESAHLDERLRLVDSLTPYEREVLARTAAERAISNATEAGIVAPLPHVLDMPLRALGALAGVWDTVRRWDMAVTRPDNTVGDALKVMPPDQVRWVERLLRLGGLISRAQRSDEDAP